MKQALIEARQAYAESEVPIGCVLVDTNSKKIISSTHNLTQRKHNPNFHAEILAIDKACKKKQSKYLVDCDIYVTVEPCIMCATAISNAKIRNLYYGAADVKQGAVENGIRFFQTIPYAYKTNIYSGIKSFESKDLMVNFFKNLRK